VKAEYDKCRIVLLGKELERGGVVERVDGVLAIEFDCERAFEGIEIGKSQLDSVARLFAPQYESGFGIFDKVRLALFQCSFGARISWSSAQRLEKSNSADWELTLVAALFFLSGLTAQNV